MDLDKDSTDVCVHRTPLRAAVVECAPLEMFSDMCILPTTYQP